MSPGRPGRRAVLRVLPLLLCAPLAACGAPADTADTAGTAAERDIRRAVARWSAAPPGRLAGIPLEDWAYEVTSVRRDGVRALARAELRYRLAGYDTAPAGSAREVELTGDGGAWRVTGDRPAPGAPPQLWDQGPVAVVRGKACLVLGVGRTPADLDRIAAEADRAVPAVSAAWPGAWAGRVVVLVPGTLDAMAALLGRPASACRGMAAVTTGRVGAGPTPADRVVINPEGYGELAEEGRRIVLTHEITHVATRAATSERTPLWLSEGFADWAAYRETPGTGRAAAEAAPELARAVRRGELPGELPANEAFGFGGDAEALARAYEGAWLVCRFIAGKWGDAALVRLYEKAGREPLATALAETLGLDPAELTRAWQEYLRDELR
ncbi:hypothetical protein MTF65_28840 [Streptomyces sp. APSN-46.1]|uniref:hypothetical protein n=1 Tax=Streptomyces sp. APSN-46.1 TaxID=2929049 RepID=UPI001FB4B4F4|nr:hypothetical protein [Streptomyces sp. APSN-46.1]MCJ1681291.1 hypothetical protein [Streptomyces sp. APSN-46.1]